jgi:hypothetical protein
VQVALLVVVTLAMILQDRYQDLLEQLQVLVAVEVVMIHSLGQQLEEVRAD